MVCLAFGVFAACDSDEKTVITAELSKTEAIVGEEVTVTYSATNDAQVSVTYSKDGGEAQAFTGNTFEAEERGVYVFTFSAEGAESVTKTLTVKTETDALFNGGIGTEEQPYEIATAEQFLNLSEVENEILSAETPYFFVLTEDIDLSDKTAAGSADQGSYLQRWSFRKTEHHKSKAHAFQRLQCFFSCFQVTS